MHKLLTDSSQWYEPDAGFFGKHYLRGDNSLEGFTEEPLTLQERTEREVCGVTSLTGVKYADRILDCPCGYGRHTNMLAAEGYHMIGLDNNPLHLAEAEKGKLV